MSLLPYDTKNHAAQGTVVNTGIFRAVAVAVHEQNNCFSYATTVS